MTKDILNTAYHEAGHAAAFIFFEIKFKLITIKPKGNCLGMITGRNLNKNDLSSLEYATPFINKNKIEKDLIIDIAGPIAEAKFRGRFNHIAASSDYTKIKEFLLRMFQEEKLSTAYYNYIFLLAKNVIEMDHVWDYIKALAVVLIKKQEMSYVECLNLFYKTNKKLIGITDD